MPFILKVGFDFFVQKVQKLYLHLKVPIIHKSLYRLQKTFYPAIPRGKIKAIHFRLKVKYFKTFQTIKVETLRKTVDFLPGRMLWTFIALSEKILHDAKINPTFFWVKSTNWFQVDLSATVN